MIKRKVQMMNHRDMDHNAEKKKIKIRGRRNRNNGLMISDNIWKYMFIKDDISRNMNGIRLKV